MKISNELMKAGWRERPSIDVFGRQKYKYGFGWQVADIHHIDQEIKETRVCGGHDVKAYAKYAKWIWRPINLKTGNYVEFGWGPNEPRIAKKLTYWCPTCKRPRAPWTDYSVSERRHYHVCCVCKGTEWVMINKGEVIPEAS